MIKFVKSQLKERGYVFDKKISNTEFRAKSYYPTGTRYLYFVLTKCEICKEDYLKPKWSSARAHNLCSMEMLNDKKGSDVENSH